MRVTGIAPSLQRIDIVVVAIDLEVSCGVDEIDHDVAAHGAECRAVDVMVAHDAGSGRMKDAGGDRGAALVEPDDLVRHLETEGAAGKTWDERGEVGLLL